MTPTTLTLAVLIALLMKLIAMREVRAAHILLGGKEISAIPKPPVISDIHSHEDNIEICNHYFYSRLVIQYSFGICVFATTGAIVLGMFTTGLGFEPPPTHQTTPITATAGTMHELKWPALVASSDGERVTAANIETSGTYIAIVSHQQIQTLKPIAGDRSTLLLLGSNGSVQAMGIIRAVHSLVFIGVISGLLCWMVAGKIKAIEEAKSDSRTSSE